VGYATGNTLVRVDGRFVLLGLIVVIAGTTARNLQPVRPPGEELADRARERAADAVLVEVDRTQLCYLERRSQYADTVPSLLFTRGHFMRLALENNLDITLSTSDDGQSYQERVAGVDVDAVLERHGIALTRLDVGDRPPPRVATGC
jgi:hypothetical protein